HCLQPRAFQWFVAPRLLGLLNSLSEDSLSASLTYSSTCCFGLRTAQEKKMLPPEGRVRVVIAEVRPEIDHGAFPTKRIAGDSVIVEADILADGHDSVAGEIVYRHERDEVWRCVSIEFR